MSEVLAAIVHRLSEEYTKIELKSEEAKKRSVHPSPPDLPYSVKDHELML